MMERILIILGSTRENRQGEKAARWIYKLAIERGDLAPEMADLRDWPLPFFNEPKLPSTMGGKYSSDLISRWAEKVSSADGFIFVTPEYNHGYPAVLKNALDHLYPEWNQKPVAFVGYSGGVGGGSRAIEQLRQVVVELQMVPIRYSVILPGMWQAFNDDGSIKNEADIKRARGMLNQLSWWAKMLKIARMAQAG